MPKIHDEKVLEVLKNPFFEGHVAMHLAREGLIQPPPYNFKMTPVDGAGGGKQFLEMHNELLRVFKYLLKNPGPGKQPVQYTFVRWDLDDPEKLPAEIQDLFRSYPDYLPAVFAGVKKRIDQADCSASQEQKDEALDDFGRFIERGNKDAKGFGFHDTLHDYIGSKERGFARGAEMNKLRDSMNNDYFWPLHTWIDGQYKRMLLALCLTYSDQEMAPDKAMAGLEGHSMAHGAKASAGVMAMGPSR